MVKKGINGFTNVDYKIKGLFNEALSRRCKCCSPPPQGQGEGRCLCGSSAARSEDCCVQPAQECQEVLGYVIFNRRKEFQWQKIAVFLKLASARGKFRQSTGALPERKGLDVSNLAEISDASSLDHATPERAMHTANLCLRLLLSRDSIVIRRLIMTANHKSLARDLISKEAAIFRALLSRALADVVCQWMVKVARLKRSRDSTGDDLGMSLSKEAPISPVVSSLQEVVRDRRMKVIFSKFVKDLREEPMLMARVGWSALVVSAVSAAIGAHRFAVLLSEEYLPTPTPTPTLRMPALAQI